MADVAGGAGYSAPVAVPPAQAQQTITQPSQGQTPAWNPGNNRGRPSDFGSWSGGIQSQDSGQVVGADGIPGQGIALANPERFEGQDPNDPFSPLAGTDAQAQALVVDENGDVVQQGEQDDGSVQAQVMSEADVRALLEEHRVWRDSDDLAGPLLQKFVPVTIDGQRYRIPVDEAVKGYQRNADYSNKLREVYALKQQVEQRESGLRRMIDDLSQSGQSFYDTVENIGLFKQFADAAIMYGFQLKEEREMSPQQRQQAAALREMRMEARRIALENKRLQAQLAQAAAQAPQQQGVDQAQAIRMQQIAHLLPSVAQRMGLVQTPLAMAEFERHFANMLPSLSGGDITTEFLETVVGATLEAVSAQVAAHKAWQEAPQQPPPTQAQLARDPRGRFAGVPPQGAPRQLQAAPPVGRMSGPSTPSSPNGRQQRARIGDFDRAVRGRPGA